MSEPTPNVVSIANRKESWTPEEAFAVAQRELAGRMISVSIVVDDADGETHIFMGKVTRKDALWHAECLRDEAWSQR